jgi:hypothetical protein
MVASCAVVGVLAVWLVASAVVQIRVPFVQRLRRYDPCHLLPRFNLFSPRPIRQDLVVRYRRWESESEAGQWRALPYYGPRPITEAFFSPHRRSRRMIYQQARRLVALERRAGVERVRVVTSAPYLHLLGCVTREAARPGPGWGLQFQVVREAHDPGRELRLAVFKSEIHELEL